MMGGLNKAQPYTVPKSNQNKLCIIPKARSTKLLSIINFTSKLLNCFVLEDSVYKRKQLRCLLVKFIHRSGLSMYVESIFQLKNLLIKLN